MGTTKWYCLNQGGDMQYVGEFDTFEEADESLKYSPVWIVDEEGARRWLQDLQQMLGENAARLAYVEEAPNPATAALRRHVTGRIAAGLAVLLQDDAL